jgi:sporulation protein YpjB
MKQSIITLLLFITLLVWPINGHAKSQDEDPWAHLTSLATEVTDTVDNGDYEGALTFLGAFSKEWGKVAKEQPLSDIQVRTLTASLYSLQKELQVQADPVQLKRSSVSFRLAVDAISSEGVPLWQSMGDQVIQSFNAVKKDVQSGNDAKFQVDLNSFLDLYQMVYPSMAIDVTSEALKNLDSGVDELANQRMTYVQNAKVEKGQLHALGGDLGTIFAQKAATVNGGIGSSLDSMIFLIGSLIVLTLIYVSWRKYNGTTAQ